MRMKQILAGLIVACVLLVSSGIATVTLQEADGAIPGSWDGGNQDILTSNGETYALTSANLITAIDSVNWTNGTVDLPPGSDLTITETIHIWYNTTLNLHGNTIRPSGDFDMFHIHYGGVLDGGHGVISAANQTSYSNTSSLVRFIGEIGNAGPKWQQEGFDSHRRQVVRDLTLIGGTYDGQHRGIGVYLCPTEALRSNAHTLTDNVKFMYLNKGMYLHLQVNAYINENEFHDVDGVEVEQFIVLNQTAGTAINKNSWTGDCFYEADGWTGELNVVNISGDCDYNKFYLNIMDWTLEGDNDSCIVLNASTNYNEFVGHFFQHSDGWIDDSGSGNTFVSAYGTNIHYINRNEADDTGIWFFYQCANGSNAIIRIYGDVSGTDKYGELFTDAQGDFNMRSNAGENIELFAGGLGGEKYVYIDNIIRMAGRTTDPSPLSDGMIWYNTTVDWYYCRAGGATYTFNLTAV